MSESKLKIKTFIFGSMRTNCYVFSYENQVYIIDPGENPKKLLNYIQDEKIVDAIILITHCHFDHIAGIDEVSNFIPKCQIYVPRKEIKWLTSPKLNLSTFEKKNIVVNVAVTPMPKTINDIKVLNVSGHSPGSVAFYLKNQQLVFSGDSLFRGTIGNCTIPDSNEETLLENIKNNLLTLPTQTKVYPGHGFKTTISNEIKDNPYFTKEK